MKIIQMTNSLLMGDCKSHQIITCLSMKIFIIMKGQGRLTLHLCGIMLYNCFVVLFLVISYKKVINLGNFNICLQSVGQSSLRILFCDVLY